MIQGKSNSWNRKETFLRFSPYIIVGALLVILPPFLALHLQNLISKILIFALFAMSLNIVYGYAGLFTLGHAAFFGVGGYTTGILIRHYGITSFWQTAPLSILMATLFAALFGLIALRVSGLQFLMVTLVLGELLSTVAWQWFGMTGGAFGLKGIPLPDIGIPGFSFSILNPLPFYYFILGIFGVSYFFMHRIVNSPFGLSLQGIREDEPRMAALGYNTWLYKYLAIIVGGFFAGISGILFAHWNMLISPRHLDITTSTTGLIYIILGGSGTLFGPVIGAALVIALEYFVSIVIPERWPLILGIIFVVAVMLVRGGIYPRVAQLWKKATGRYSYGSTTN